MIKSHNNIKFIDITDYRLSRVERVSPLIRIISWILIFSLVNLTTGCYYYRVNVPKNPDSSTIANLHTAKKFIVLHFEQSMWQLESIKIDEKTIGGTLSELRLPTKYRETDPTRINRYYKNQKVDESWVLNEVHIHISEYIDLGNGKISFPFEAIKHIQIYDADEAANAGSWIFSVIGIPLAALGLIFLIVLLTKDSCPFIYVHDGNQYNFVGEIYSGAIYPQLERHDYLSLPLYSPCKEEYRIKMSNEVKEIQNTNFCELWVFDHDQKIEVLVDKYGTYQTISNPILPSYATSISGVNVTNIISSRDSLHYFGQHVVKDELTDGLILEFPKPQEAKMAKLSIRAKNSFFLDYMMGQFHNLFGDVYHKWREKQANATEEQLMEWTINQNIPLSLYVDRRGQWEFVDYYHIAGPMAFKNDIIAIPLDESDSTPLKVKLEYGANLWEIDYVAVDYTENTDITIHKVPIMSAVTNSNKDVKRLLQKIDKKYYTQPNVGDYAELVFTLPQLQNEHRTVILHSRGYYQVLRDPKGKPDIGYLEKFREPGQFNRFCNEHIELIIKEHSLE
jgi:hypothetical protein